MPYLTGDAPVPNTFICRVLRIPADQGFLLAVNGAISSLMKSYNWEQFGTLTPEESAQMGIDLWINYVTSEVCMIGTIQAYATLNPPAHCLICDGSQHLRTDYPTLYANLEAAYIVDADHFNTPDLRGQFVIGASIDYPATTNGGEAAHTMTELELVPHAHTTVPHTHTEAAAAPTVVSIGLEPPVPSAVPSASVTGPADVIVNATGGGQPFPILPPYTALKYCIVAR